MSRNTQSMSGHFVRPGGGGGGERLPTYTGDTTVTSNTTNTQTLETRNKSVLSDITINPNVTLEEQNPQGGITFTIF